MVDCYQVDAFASKPFEGNPAGVVVMSQWMPDALMQAIAAENNLAETAFLVGESASQVGESSCDYRIRWFTPWVEVDLCGHATLAAAHVLWRHLGHPSELIRLASRSGALAVRRDGDLLELDFPATPALAPLPREEIQSLAAALRSTPTECYGGVDRLCVFAAEAEILDLAPDLVALGEIDARGIIVTAAGSQHDFVSRFFAPRVGVDEDHVTGSAHCTLTPYWAGRLGLDVLRARQVSERGGELRCTLAGDRVRIAGHAVTYLEGRLSLDI